MITSIPLHHIKRACAMMALISFSSPMLVLAQPDGSVSNSFDRVPIHFAEQQADGSNRGRPGGREGTGSRGGCPAANIPLTALVPTSNLELAVEAAPTFWFYVPYKSELVATGEFALQDEANNDIYRTALTLPGTPGIVSFSLPSTAPLELNQTYQWYFKLYCDRQKLAESVFVRGWVRRVALKVELNGQLQPAITPQERIALYAKNGIWQSALTDLAKLRLAEPQNTTFNREWAEMLKAVGLEDLAREPIVGSVKANSPPEYREPRNTEVRSEPRERVERDGELRL